MNILDGSWMSYDKNNLFHEAMDNDHLIRSGLDGMASLDRSANGQLDGVFFSNNKTSDDGLNDSLKFMNRSGLNLNDDSRVQNISRSWKQCVSGFQPYQPFQAEPTDGALTERTRIPAMCIATRMEESEPEQQEDDKSEKSEFVVANYKSRDDDSLQAQLRNKKNQTKNIPKNYGKAIITFMQRNKAKIIQLFGGPASQQELMAELKGRKKSINTIRDIRDLWTKSKFAKEFRIISNLFLRKYAFEYIFNSRITNYSSHIKYRHKLREAVESPDTFICIKDKDY